MLLKHIAHSGKPSFSLERLVDDRGVILRGDHKGENHNLAAFPDLYFVSLTVLLSKRGFYFNLSQALAAIEPNTPALVSRQFDLQDHWLREIVYLERVLELAIQWSRTDPPRNTCQALFLFVSQEATSTDHSLESARQMHFTHFNEGILRDSESFSSTLNSAHTGRQPWTNGCKGTMVSGCG